MRKIVAILGLVLLLVASMLMGSTGVLGGPPAGTWVSGIQIQNPNTETATVEMTFYWAAGTANAGQAIVCPTEPFTIAGGLSRTFFVPSHLTCVPVNFVGSVVLTSDYPVVAIINTQKTPVGNNDPSRMASALGENIPATKVYVPMLRKDFYNRNTYVAVQNTEATAATVYFNYYSDKGQALPAAREVVTVPAYSTKIFYQNDNANLPLSLNGFNGSGVITSTVRLAVVVNQANAGTTAGNSGFESYNGATSGATTIYMPKMDVNYYTYYQSGFQVQNIGEEPAYMTATYTFGNQVFTKASPKIEPGSAWVVFLANSPVSGIPAGFSGTGAAVIESTQPVVGVVNETNDAVGHSYITSAFTQESATDTVVFPKFDSLFYGQYNSGITIQNLGTTTTTVTVVFSNQLTQVDTQVVSGDIAPGASKSWYGPSVVPALGTQFTGSVVVFSNNGQKIAGIHTEFNTTLLGDTFTAYNGINN